MISPPTCARPSPARYRALPLARRLAPALASLTPGRHVRTRPHEGLRLQAHSSRPSPDPARPHALRLTLQALKGQLAVAQQHLPLGGTSPPDRLAFSPGTWLQPDPELADYQRLQRINAVSAPRPWLRLHGQALWADHEAGTLAPSGASPAGGEHAEAQSHGYHAGVHLLGERLGVELAYTAYHHEGHGAGMRGRGAFAIDGATHQRGTLGLRWQVSDRTDLLLAHSQTQRRASNRAGLIQRATLHEHTTRVGLEHRWQGHQLGVAVGYRRHRGGEIELRVPSAITAQGELRYRQATIAVAPSDAVLADAFWRFPLLGGHGLVGGFREGEETGGMAAWGWIF